MTKTLKILLTICSAFGICVEGSRCCGRNVLHLFRIYVMLLMGILFFNTIFGIIRSKIMNEFIVSWAVSTIVFISQMITYFIIMYEALTKHQEHTDFIRILHDIDIFFKIFLKMNIQKSAIIAEIFCSIVFMIVMSKIGLALFALTFLIYAEDGYYWWALMAILAIRFRFIQVIMYVEILKYYMLALNKKLNQVVCLKTEESKQILDVDYKYLQSMEVIRNIKHLYASIHKASILMNEFARASMFAATVSNFLDFTCHIYWTLLTFDNLLPAYYIVSSTATILPLGFFTLKFCYICQLLKDESRRTSLLLSRLVSSVNHCPSINKSYKNLVHDFCMQIMHQRIVFTGNLFFTFDLKCVFTICSLTATHLIILIQFTKSDSNHNMNNTNAEAA